MIEVFGLAFAFGACVLVARASIYTAEKYTFGMWVAIGSAAWFTIETKDVGVWAPLFSGAPVPIMFAVAVPIFVPLLFAATTFNSVATPSKEDEKYFFTYLDRFHMRTSWASEVMLSKTFYLAVLLICGTPLALPFVSSRYMRCETVSIGLWCACALFVYLVLLANAIVVLESSLVRLLRRHSLPQLVEQKWEKLLSRRARRGYLHFSRHEAQNWLELAARQLPNVPDDQQARFIDVAFNSRWFGNEARKVTENVLNREQRAASPPKFLCKKLERIERYWQEHLHRTNDNRVQAIVGVERVRARVLISARQNCTSESLTELLHEIVAVGSLADELWRSLARNDSARASLAHSLLDKAGDVGVRSYRTRAWSWGTRDEPEVVSITFRCFRDVIDGCLVSIESEAQKNVVVGAVVERTLRLNHKVTKDVLLRMLSHVAIRELIITPSDGRKEMGFLRERYLPTNRFDSTDSNQMHFAPYLRASAHVKLTSNADISAEAVRELLRFLDYETVLACFFGYLQDMDGRHSTPDTKVLSAYRDELETWSYHKPDKVDFRPRAQNLLPPTITHFCDVEDLEFFVSLLGSRIGRPLLRKLFDYRTTKRSRLPLFNALLWCCLAQPVDDWFTYSSDEGLSFQVPELNEIRRAVRSVVQVLEAVDVERATYLKRSLSWTNDIPDSRGLWESD